MVSRPFSLVVQAGLIAALAFVLTGFVRSDHQVELSVDERSTSVQTYAKTVGDLLEEQQVAVSDRDLVVPSVETPLSEAESVTVRHARPVEVVVDGQSMQLWTTALTVEGALEQAGVRSRDAELSASRSDRVPLTGTRVGVQMPDQVTVVHDNRRITLHTTARTVSDVLKETRVQLDRDDKLNVKPSRAVQTGLQIVVTRVKVNNVRHFFAIDHRTIRKADSSLYEGETRVVQRGHDGRGVVVSKVVRHDGTVVRRIQVKRDVLRPPQPSVVRVGTKPRPYSPPSTGAEGLNWAALAGCESGGNPQAVNPAGYYGLYQFALSTWYSVGGSGNPIDASAEEQTYRAQLLYQRSGSAPWPVCGPLLYS